MPLVDLYFTACATGAKITLGIGLPLLRTLGESLATFMIPSTDQMIDVPGESSESLRKWDHLLTVHSDGPDAYNCALPGFHCSTLNIINKVGITQEETE